MISELNKKIENLECLVKSPPDRTNPNPQRLQEQITQGAIVNESSTANAQSSSTNLVDNKELQRRRRKKLNICIFNLPESEALDESSAYSDDMGKLKDILFPQEGFNPEHVQQSYRIGRKSDDKVRPIVIKFSDAKTRENVLKMSNLVYMNNSEIVKLYINVDKTKIQVQEHKNLVKELKNRREAGEQNLVIKGNEIVQKQSFLPTPQSVWSNTLRE